MRSLLHLARRGRTTGRGLGAIFTLLISYPIATLAFLGATFGALVGGSALITKHVPEPKQEAAKTALSGVVFVVVVGLIFWLSAKYIW